MALFTGSVVLSSSFFGSSRCLRNLIGYAINLHLHVLGRNGLRMSQIYQNTVLSIIILIIIKLH